MLKRNWTQLRRSIRQRRASQGTLLPDLLTYPSTRRARKSSLTSVFLPDLPVELLRLIFEFFCAPDGSRAPLLHLALTCHAFWVLARQYIPRDVKVYPHSTSTTFALFKRSVTEDSSYAQNVRSLVFSKGDNDCDISAKQIRQLLKCLPALRTLDLGGLPHEHIMPTLFSDPLELKSTLGKLDIPGGLNVAQVAELLSFPVVRKWRFWQLDDFGCHAKFPEVEDVYLKELQFENCQIGFPLFENVLSRCRDLKILGCNLPFLPPLQPSTTAAHEVDIERPFSALQLRAPLLHVAKSLSTLKLHSQGQTWRNHDGTRLDLSDFPELKHIELSAMCFCAPLSGDIPRDGLFKLLPRSTETFKLHFPPNIGLFYSTSDGRVIVEEYSHFFFYGASTSAAHWIHEFALHKATSLPNLISVGLHEDPKGQRDQTFESQNWLQPSYLRAAFDEAHIVLSVSLRKSAKD